MRALHAIMLTLLVMAGWHLQAAARIVAEAAADVMTDPQAALNVSQAVQHVDPLLAVADPATPATVDPQLITTEPAPAYEEVLAVAPGQADIPASLSDDDASFNVMTHRWPWGRKRPPPGLGGTAGGQSSYCGAMAPSGGCDKVTDGTKTIQCDVAPKNYSSTDGRFIPSNFQHSCLGDAALHCAEGANTVNPNRIQADSSCCSCYLYSQIASTTKFPKVPYQGKSYALSKARLNPSTGLSAVWHLMVMPFTPCTGVENWHVTTNTKYSQCPGEDIWDVAQNVIDTSIDCVSDRFLWGMAINPVSGRGQHQMHVHVAQVYPELLASVGSFAGLALSKIPLPTPTMELDCGLERKKSGTTRLQMCQMAATSSQGSQTKSNLEVTIVSKIGTPAAAKPFENTYTTKPSNDLSQQKPRHPDVALWGSTLVLRVPWTSDSWAIVMNPEGPAECFFNPQPDPKSPPDCDLVKACQTLPADCALYRQCNKAPTTVAECSTWRSNNCLYQPAVDCSLLRPCFDRKIKDDCDAYKSGGCGFITTPPQTGDLC